MRLKTVMEAGEHQTPTVFFPAAYNEVTSMADQLLSQKPIIINLTQLGHQDRLRILDFVCGVGYAVSAHRELLDSGIYLFSFKR